MNLHEYQSKQLFADYGIPVPVSDTAATAEEAEGVARHLGGEAWVVKAQIHGGGRGKAGGVKRVADVDELRRFAAGLLGSRLVTEQTGPEGQPVSRILVEQPGDIAVELYLSCLVDRASERVVFVASAAGGMDIEAVAAESPERILRVVVDPTAGLQAFQCRQLAFGLGLGAAHIRGLSAIMQGMYRMFLDKDLSLVEINPLAVTAGGGLLAIDAKITADDNALYRQPSLAELRDPEQEDPTEYQAQQHGLNYVKLDGEIGCMVNGAGLAMATMDLIKLHGAEPANFLDVGGGTTADKVAEAFKIIVSDPRVKAILVNIFGGIVRCDLIAEGIIQAVREIGLELPVVVRLEGTRVEEGRALLARSGLSITTADGLTDAARKAVEASRA